MLHKSISIENIGNFSDKNRNDDNKISELKELEKTKLYNLNCVREYTNQKNKNMLSHNPYERFTTGMYDMLASIGMIIKSFLRLVTWPLIVLANWITPSSSKDIHESKFNNEFSELVSSFVLSNDCNSNSSMDKADNQYDIDSLASKIQLSFIANYGESWTGVSSTNENSAAGKIFKSFKDYIGSGNDPKEAILRPSEDFYNAIMNQAKCKTHGDNIECFDRASSFQICAFTDKLIESLLWESCTNKSNVKASPSQNNSKP